MPIYEYQCQKCHHHFEELQKVSDAPVAHCPKCKGAVTRLISQTSFSLKGEGWYKDGYAKPAPAKPADAGKTEVPKPAEGTPKVDTATASKPAAQPATSKNPPAPSRNEIKPGAQRR